MRAVETYFAFHEPTSLVSGKPIWTAFGHVEAFGYTMDDTWFFFDPSRKGTSLLITHRKDDVEDLMAGVIARSERIYKTDHRAETYLPALLPQTCVSQCAALIGVRAYTPSAFERRLIALNAEVIHARRKQRR